MILDEDGKAKPGIKYKAYRTPVLGKTPKHRTVGGVLGHFPKAIVTRELGHAFPRQFRNPEMGVSENVVYPIVPNGFADHYPGLLNGYFIGNINPTFSDKPK